MMIEMAAMNHIPVYSIRILRRRRRKTGTKPDNNWLNQIESLLICMRGKLTPFILFWRIVILENRDNSRIFV